MVGPILMYFTQNHYTRCYQALLPLLCCPLSRPRPPERHLRFSTLMTLRLLPSKYRLNPGYDICFFNLIQGSFKPITRASSFGTLSKRYSILQFKGRKLNPAILPFRDPRVEDYLSMDSAQDRLFYRCYSNESAGQLRSGRHQGGHPALSEEDLLYKFDIHRIRENRQPTVLVSVTNRPLEALNRALAKYYHLYEDPGEIWIAIIQVPGSRKSYGLHHAQSLARQRKYPDVEAFKYEYVFEWEIPQVYVKHRVSVKTQICWGIKRMIAAILRPRLPKLRSSANRLSQGDPGV